MLWKQPEKKSVHPKWVGGSLIDLEITELVFLLMEAMIAPFLCKILSFSEKKLFCSSFGSTLNFHASPQHLQERFYWTLQ